MMTRKTLVCGALAVILTLACANTAFAQKKNAVGLDLIPLFRGMLATNGDEERLFVPFALSYERVIAAHYSIGVDVDVTPGKVADEDGGYLYFGLGLAARYYPQSNGLDKFFMGATIGYNMQSIDGKTKVEEGGFSGLFITMRTGYKVVTKSGFFLEPSISYTYSKTNDMTFGMTPQAMFWQPGLRLGFSF